MELEIIACEEKEKFTLYQINRLIKSNFGQKSRKFDAFISISFSGPQLASTISASPTSSGKAAIKTSSLSLTPALYNMQ